MAKQEAVGRAIRSARVERGITLRALAADLGVSPATLSGIETGRTPVTVNRLQQIAVLIDVSPSRLVSGETPPPARPAIDGRHDWRNFDDLTLDPVLEAAARVFVRRGFHAAGMREVANEAGLSVAGVYHHHPSKERLLVALLDVTMAELRWRIAAARAEGDSPVRSFALMVEALALFHAVRGDLAFLGASEMRGVTGAERERVVALRNDLQYALDDQARRCLDSGAFRCPDPHTATRAIATMCTALPGWYRPDGPLSPAHVAARYADYALALLGAEYQS